MKEKHEDITPHMYKLGYCPYVRGHPGLHVISSVGSGITGLIALTNWIEFESRLGHDIFVQLSIAVVRHLLERAGLPGRPGFHAAII